MRHLTFLESRRQPWTEHPNFPIGAIKAWRKRQWWKMPLQIWAMNRDGLCIFLRMTVVVDGAGTEWVEYTDGRREKLSDVWDDLERITE